MNDEKAFFPKGAENFCGKKPKEEQAQKEITSPQQAVEALKKLNPDAKIELSTDVDDYDPELKMSVSQRISDFGGEINGIYSSVPPQELIIPNGLAYTKKNGWTNKHLTKGTYFALKARVFPGTDISKYPQFFEKPKEEQAQKEITSPQQAVEALKKLNPDAKIELSTDVDDYDPELKMSVSQRISDFGGEINGIYSSVPPQELIIPNGLAYTKKNGWTNKHLTKGTYFALKARVFPGTDISKYRKV